MDNLRGQYFDSNTGSDWAGEAWQSADDAADAPEDELVGDIPPVPIGQEERRMQLRAYSSWAGLVDARDMPAITDLQMDALPDFSANGVLLDFAASDCGGNAQNPAISWLGAKLATECDAPHGVRHLADVPKGSLLEQIAAHYPQIVASRAPVAIEAECVNQRGATLLYRGILLPFADEAAPDTPLRHVLGVINWKEQASDELNSALLREMGMALGSAFVVPPAGFAPDAARVVAPLAPAPAITTNAALGPLAQRLDGLAARPLAEISAKGDEYAVLVVRRRADGPPQVLGEIGDCPELLSLAAWHLGV
jgi:hypothetical protein